MLRLRENLLKHLLLISKLIIARYKAKVNVRVDLFLQPVQNLDKLICLIICIFIVWILGRDREATLSLEKVPVLFVLELFAQHNHLYEDAADSPDVTPFAIALVCEDDLRRTVPSGHDCAGHLAGLGRELVTLIVEQRG